MESLPHNHHVYIKKDDNKTAQREGLNMMLMMSQQTKAGDQQLVITSDVMNIADILIIWDLDTMPPAHLTAQALTKFNCKGAELSQKDLKQIITALAGDAINDQSSTKATPKHFASPLAKLSKDATISDSDSESDKDSAEDESSTKYGKEVVLRVPTHEDNLKLVQRLRAGISSSGTRTKLNEADMLAKMVEGVNKLQAPHIISMFSFYIAHGPNASMDERKEWISAQARAAEAIRRGIDASYHQYLTLRTNLNSVESEEAASVQGSKFIKCLVHRIIGSDDQAIARQEKQLIKALEEYSTMSDIDKYSERVNAEITWYYKMW